jgi:AraC-like DNA-binding protein
MDDFASASMLRLLLRAMAARGLPPPLPLPDAARASLADKRLVVSAIAAAGGLPLLLQLAQQVEHIEGEPLHQALAAAQSPADLLARWQRLEQYVHARHRVQLRGQAARAALAAQAAQVMELAHCAPGGEPPQAAESVAVLGVWIGALQAIGVQGLRVDVGRHCVHGPGATALVSGAAVNVWRFRWSSLQPPPRTPCEPASTTWPWPEPAASLAAWLMHDLAAPARAAVAASAMGLSLRSLQRQLRDAGLPFSELLGEVRVRRAGSLLLQAQHSVAEIGFVCGYADQAHFTREFSRRAGLPPARFRAATLALP